MLTVVRLASVDNGSFINTLPGMARVVLSLPTAPSSGILTSWGFVALRDVETVLGPRASGPNPSNRLSLLRNDKKCLKADSPYTLTGLARFVILRRGEETVGFPAESVGGSATEPMEPCEDFILAVFCNSLDGPAATPFR